MSDYLTPSQVRAEYHLPERTQERRRYEGTGPKFVKAGRRVLYKRSDIEDWFAANTFSSTSEAAERGQ